MCGFKVLFKETHYNQLIRKKQFNEVDFLSFVGGLLGLFAGFSALSFVEILYWLFGRLLRIILAKNLTKTGGTAGIYEENTENDNKNGTGPDLIHEVFLESSIHGFNYILRSNIFET